MARVYDTVQLMKQISNTDVSDSSLVRSELLHFKLACER